MDLPGFVFLLLSLFISVRTEMEFAGLVCGTVQCACGIVDSGTVVAEDRAGKREIRVGCNL